jgi:hypothetical protein
MKACQEEIGNALRAFDGRWWSGINFDCRAARQPSLAACQALHLARLCKTADRVFVRDILRTCPASPTSSSRATPNHTIPQKSSAPSSSPGSCPVLAAHWNCSPALPLGVAPWTADRSDLMPNPSSHAKALLCLPVPNFCPPSPPPPDV